MLQNGCKNNGNKKNDPFVFHGIETSSFICVCRDKHDKVRFSTKNVGKEMPAQKGMKLI